jgi:putative flippase GtrA
MSGLPSPSMNASQILDDADRPGMNAGREPAGVRSEFLRYFLVGGFAFVCDTFTLFFLTHFLKVNYLVSAPVGFLVGTAVNYVLSRTWVFQRRTLARAPAADQLLFLTKITLRRSW